MSLAHPRMDALPLFARTAPKLKDSALKALAVLREVGVLGVTRRESIDAGVGNMPGRVQELRLAGFRIDTVGVHDASHSRWVLREEPS